MTCQWCVHYRRRKKGPCCLNGDKFGKTFKGHHMVNGCEDFIPRRICTTCGRRCLPEEMEANLAAEGGCQHWVLRALSTWGGWRGHKKEEGEAK